MDTLVKHLARVNERKHYWNPRDLLLLAVSGGADSMALLDAMSQLPESQKPNLKVIHVHHHLRPEADEEAMLVERACRDRDIPFIRRDWDRAEHPASGLEAAAREARYRYLSEEMAASGADAIVTGHHGDDQMETILMRLTRGSTIVGMAGIKPIRPFKSGQLLRPFLGVEKEELYAYCQRNGIAYHEDSSNFELVYTRNRYRQQVLPFLKEENAQAVRHFQEFSEDLLALWEIATPQVAAAVTNNFDREGDVWVLSIPRLQELTWGVRHLILGYFLQRVWGLDSDLIQRSHVEDILDLMDGSQPQAVLHLPNGRRVQRKYNKILFLTGEEQAPTSEEEEELPFLAKLGLNQWLELPFNGKMGLFSYNIGKDLLVGMQNSEAIHLEEGTRLPLAVRHPQAGDRIRLNPAAPFTKKLARLFIDRKVAHERRHQALVVQEESGEILWVPGYAVSLHALPVTKEGDRNTLSQSGYLVIYKKR